MSDTPRVDEYIRAYNEKEKWARDMSPVELAEQLERENAALRADAERYRYIKNSETVEVSGILQTFCVSMTFDLDAAVDAARAKEDQS